MKKILRHWLKLGRAPRVAFFRKIADNLAQTPPPLANPNPPLVDYEAAVAAAEARLSEIDQLEQQLKAVRAAAVEAVDAASAATELMARRAEDATSGHEAALLAIGFELTSGEAQAVGPMTQPLNFMVTAGDDEGELDWQCEPVRGADSYEAASTATPTDAASWKVHPVVSRSRASITGLPSGVRQYVRVRAFGPQGPGPWSDVATRMVP